MGYVDHYMCRLPWWPFINPLVDWLPSKLTKDCWPELAMTETLRTEHDGPQTWWLWMIKNINETGLQICPTLNTTGHENWYQGGTSEQQLHRCNLWSGCKSVLKIPCNWWKSKNQTPRHFSPFWNGNLHARAACTPTVMLALQKVMWVLCVFICYVMANTWQAGAYSIKCN